MEATSPSRLLVLGSIRVEQNGTGVRELGEGTSARLLALLAGRAGECVPSDALVEAAWLAGAPTNSRGALQVQIHRLRRLLGEAGPSLLTDPRGYRLVADATTLDLMEFRSRSRSARRLFEAGEWRAAIAEAETALSLWKGEPFAGLEVELGLESESVLLNELRLDLEEEVAAARLEIGDEAVVETLRRMVQESPLRERRWGQLMLALYRTGRQAEALRVFQEAAALLEEELGLSPGPELRELEERILLQDPGLGVGTARLTGTIPTTSEPLIGRDSDVKGLAEWVERHRLVTVTGLGGVGKTRLARTVAERLISTFGDGVAWVNLTDAERIGPEVTLLSSLGIGTHGGDAREELVYALQGRHVLIALDGIRHVRDRIRPTIDSILDQCPRVHLLLTGRLPLGHPAEHIWPLEPLELPADSDRSEMAASLELFVHAARRVRPDFELTSDDLVAATSICRLVGGIPLAIELAAAGVRARSVDELASQLAANPLSIDAGAPEERRLTPVLEWAIDQLSEEQSEVLAALSVFRGWDQQAQQVVLGEVGVDPTAVDSLVEASLVDFDSHTGRYSISEPVRQVAAARSEIVASSARAHTGYFVGLAQAALPELNSLGETRWYEVFQREHDNFRAILGRGLRERDPAMLGCLASLGLFWFRRGHLTEGLRWFDEVWESFDILGAGEPLGALQAAHLAMWSGDPDKAMARLDRIEPGFQAIGVPSLEGRILHGRGNVTAWGRGRPDQSLDWFHQAYETLAPVQDPLAVVSGLSEAYMAVKSGDSSRAEAMLPLVEAASAFNEAFGALGIDQVAGLIALYSGDLDEAERLLSRSLTELVKLGMTTLRGPLLVPLVWVAVLDGRLDVARERATNAYEFVMNENSGWRIGEVCTGFGMVELVEGNRAAAHGWFSRGFKAAVGAPEFDLVLSNAAGLVEVGNWSSPREREDAAAMVRAAHADSHLVAPPGTAAIFRITSEVDPAERPVRVTDLKRMMREVLIG